ncbi:hypothetical protein KSP39_PZI011630 [Platanthera zijinensis]|uniref:Uncharacterized protein n=1 Tax=Platanthera zijinensis TaxID=2320716 RepID=A0AAP0G5P1_9ASPA
MPLSCQDTRLCLPYHNLDAASGGQFSVGILTFETAAAMARLVSLHQALSEPELGRLWGITVRSPGVSYLTSTDLRFVFRLACAELLSDLDSAAAVISRLSTRCKAEHLKDFPRAYAEFKAGLASNAFIQTFSIKRLKRQVVQKEKWIAVVTILFEEMEMLAKMEAAEKKIFLMSIGRLEQKKTASGHAELPRAELRVQRKMVARLKEDSLWCKTFDEAVAIMSQSLLSIFANVCSVFGAFVPSLPKITVSGDRMSFTAFNNRIRVYPMNAGQHHIPGQMETCAVLKEVDIRNSCLVIGKGGREAEQKLPKGASKKVMRPEMACTVGGCCMEIPYANVILLAEKLMAIKSGEEVFEEEAVLRDGIYQQLPASLTAVVRRRLRERWLKRGTSDSRLAEGWRVATESILVWLGPVARDTLRWHEERRLDRRQRLSTRPRVLALQTLIFSDREKTEVAIMEVLVGLSCNCWYVGSPVGENHSL